MTVSYSIRPVFRHTFLNNHISELLRPKLEQKGENRTGWNGRLSEHEPAGDILALLELRQSVYYQWLRCWGERGRTISNKDCDRFRQKLCQLTRPEEFFYGMTELNLYRPVKIVEHHTEGGATLKRSHTDLTELIRSLLRPFAPVAAEPIGPQEEYEVPDTGESTASGTGEEVAAPDRSHIVLTTRTGAGKTVACWKSFYDCLVSDPEEDQGLLEDYVPCWLHSPKEELLNTTLQKGWPQQTAEGPESFRDLSLLVLLALTSGLIDSQSTGNQVRDAVERIKYSLTHGPSLLLFIDLNHVSQDLQLAIAHAIAAFHKQGKTDNPNTSWERHRIVVAYRTTLAGSRTTDKDPILEILCQPSVARRYDLEPLDKDKAVTYLRNVRAFERSLYEQLQEWFHEEDFSDLSVWRSSARKIEEDQVVSSSNCQFTVDESHWQKHVSEECRLLRDLIQRTQQDRESLISTPLLMHWTASLRPNRLPFVQNVTHLYHEIVFQYLERHDSQINAYQEPGLSRNQTLIALTRIALTMLQPDVPRLGKKRVNKLLVFPAIEDFLDSQAGEEEIRFWTKYGDQEISYFCESLNENISAVLRCGLLREVDGQVGFLHDSLVYYFAGVLGLHHFKGPGYADELGQLPNNWSQHVAARMARQPDRWLLAAEFLGGSLVPMAGLDSPFSDRRIVSDSDEWSLPPKRVEAVHEVARYLLLANPDPFLPGLLLRFLRGFGQEQQDTVLRALRYVLMRQGRLDLLPPKPIEEDGQEERHEGPLRFATPFPPEQLGQDVFNFLYWIEKDRGPCHEFAREMLEPMREIGRKTGRKWLRQIDGPRPSLTQSIHLHDGAVKCLATCSDGRILSGGDDGNLFAWDPDSGHVEHLAKVYGAIRSLFIDDNDGVIYQRDSSRLLRWDAGRQMSEELVNWNRKLNDVVLGPSRKTLYAATEGARVIGIDVSADRTVDYDPFEPPHLSLHGQVHNIDQLIPFKLQPHSELEPTTEELLLIDQDGGRILQWRLGLDTAIMIYQAEERQQIRSAVLDDEHGVLFKLIEPDSYDSLGIWSLSLMPSQDLDPDTEPQVVPVCVSPPSDKGWLADFKIDGDPVLFRNSKTKNDKDVKDVYRWQREESSWKQVGGFINNFEPVGALPGGRLVLKKRSSIWRGRNEKQLDRVHLLLEDDVFGDGPYVTSHVDSIRVWTVDASGRIVSADNSGRIKRGIIDPVFQQDSPFLGLSQRQLLVDAHGNFAKADTSWHVSVWYPGTSSSYAFSLDGRTELLTAFENGQLCAVTHEGHIYLLDSDRKEKSIAPALGTEYSLEQLQQAVFSAAGLVAYSTNSILSDCDIYRQHMETGKRERLSHQGMFSPRIAIDAKGNLLIVTDYKTLYWPIGESDAYEVELRLGNDTKPLAAPDGTWYFGDTPTFRLSEFSNPSTLRRWDPADPDTTQVVCEHKNMIGPIVVSKDGQTVISAEIDESLSGKQAFAYSHRRRLATRCVVKKSMRDPETGQWSSEILFEFRAEVGCVGLSPNGDAFATSLDGTLQFASSNGQQLCIETGEVIALAVADPHNPIIAFAPHEQGMTVLAIEPDASVSDVILPYRREDHLNVLKVQLTDQLNQNAPPARIERILKEITEHESPDAWSTDRILAAVAPEARLPDSLVILEKVSEAYEALQASSEQAAEFRRRLVQLMGIEDSEVLGPTIRQTAHYACVKLGICMVEPVLELINDSSRVFCINCLMALQNIDPLDERVEQLIQRLLIDVHEEGMDESRREVREQTRQWLVEREYLLVQLFADRGNLPAAAACYARWERLVAANGVVSLPITTVKLLPVTERDNMSRAIGSLAGAHAQAGDLLEALRWLQVCHTLTPANESPGISIRLARREASVTESLVEANGFKPAPYHQPEKLIRRIDECLSEKDEDDLEFPWWLRSLNDVSDEFVEQLIDADQLEHATKWIRHSQWYEELHPDPPESGRDVCLNAAKSCRKLAKCYVSSKDYESALTIVREGLAAMQRHIATGGNEDYPFDELVMLNVDCLTHRAEEDVSLGDMEAAFAAWEEAWMTWWPRSSVRWIDNCPKDIATSLKKSLAAEIRSVDDPLVVSVTEQLTTRQSQSTTSELRDFYRQSRLRILVDLLDTYDEDEARQRVPAARKLVDEFAQFESDKLRDEELKYFVDELFEICKDEELFRAVYYQVKSHETRYHILLQHLVRRKESERWDDIAPLAEEALELWSAFPLESSSLWKLDYLPGELDRAIDRAVDDSQFDWAIEMLPWFDRLSKLRRTFAEKIPDLKDEDRTHNYSRHKACVMVQIAIGYSKCDDDESHISAEKLIQQAQAIANAEEDSEKFLLKEISEARTNILAKQLPQLSFEKSRPKIEEICYEPHRHWLLHLLALRVAESGDVQLATNLHLDMQEIEKLGKDYDRRSHWERFAIVESTIAAVALKRNDSELYSNWLSAFETSFQNAEVKSDWQRDNVIEVEVDCRRTLVVAAIGSQQLHVGAYHILQAIRSVEKLTEAEQRGEYWYELIHWLTWLDEMLLERGPWGRGVGSQLLSWLREMLDWIADPQGRDYRTGWLAYLYGELDNFSIQSELLNSIKSEQMKTCFMPFQAALEAGQGDFQQAQKTLEAAQLEADRLDPEQEIPWLRGLLSWGAEIVASRKFVDHLGGFQELLESLETSSVRISALTRMGCRLSHLSRTEEVLHIMEQAVGELENIDSESKELVIRDLSNSLQTAALLLTEHGNRDIVERLIQMIPDVQVQQETNRLIRSIPEQQRLLRSGEFPINPFPIFMAADTAELPDHTVLQLLSPESDLLSDIEELKETSISETVLKDVWKQLDRIVLANWFGPTIDLTQNEI